MIDLRIFRRDSLTFFAVVCRMVLLVLVAELLPACGIAQSLQIQPAHKSSAISPRFSESYYSYDRDQTVTFIMRSSGTDQASGKPIEQLTTMRVFWRPKGGVTTLNASALNATIRYVVMTPDALGIYEGAGFVRLNTRTGASRLQARVMDADIRLTQKTDSFVDNLGRAHVKGYFTATFNDEKTSELMLNAQQEFFGRSLTGKPAATIPGAVTMTQPSTIPTSQP